MQVASSSSSSTLVPSPTPLQLINGNANINPFSLSSYSPTNSATHRAHLSQLFSGLRRVKPRVPFWQLAAHRVPTLWTLYRGLLRGAPTEAVRWRFTMFMKRNQHLTSPQSTKEKLQIAHKWLDRVQRASSGDPYWQRVFVRYDRLIEFKHEKTRMQQIIREAFAFQQKLANRPIVTGALMRSTIYNRPLPRLKPQPRSIGNMIRKRVRARERRGEQYALLKGWDEDMRLERRLEQTALAKMKAEGVNGEEVENLDLGNDWSSLIHAHQRNIRKSISLETSRATTPPSPELLKQLREARANRIVNKTRELNRERTGELTRRALRRARQGPPAPILAMMSEKKKKNDKVIRSLSEVGYVAKVKRLMGVKLKDPEKWKVEGNASGNTRKLERVVEEENRKRRDEARKDLKDLEKQTGENS